VSSSDTLSGAVQKAARSWIDHDLVFLASELFSGAA